MELTFHKELQLGPIVGFTDSTSTKIWLRTKDDTPFTLRYVPAQEPCTFQGRGFAPIPAGPFPGEVAFSGPFRRLGGYYTARVELTGLSPNTRYFYEVASSAEIAAHPSEFANASPPSFRTLPEQYENLSFVFLSCNDVHKTPALKEPTAMWLAALDTVVAKQGAHFAILGGDQIYADAIRGEVQKRIRNEQPVEPELIDARYGDTYLAYWDWPEIRLFMAHVPCMMMWDDHDIYDGYGSHGDESSPLATHLYAAAERAFDSHQAAHNPAPLAGAAGHRAFGFRLGSRAFLVLDARSNRRIARAASSHLESTVLGDEQMQQVKSWLVGQSEVTHLVVVSGVPLVFLPAISQAALNAAATVGADDDLNDQWSSPGNRNDQLRVLGTLFEFYKRTGATVLAVGGDVHAAALGSIRATDARYCRLGENAAVIHQLVASGIARSPAPFVLYGRVANETQVLTPTMSASFGPVYHNRNFAIVETRSEHVGDNLENRFVLRTYLEDNPVVRADVS